MKRQTDNPRQIVARFLGTMGEPVSDEQSDRATQEVLERLRDERDENVRGLRVVSERRLELQPSRSRVWSAIAATVVVMLAGGLLQMTLLRSADADVIARSARGELVIEGKADVFPPSSRIEEGKVVRAPAGGTIALLDGSQIDMSPGAELSVVRASDGLRVRLSTGTVLVTAAKQRDGHLYVETKDCLISVVGTVFAVNAEEGGSRVSVIEGEVHVQRGDETRTLLAGQQVSTSPQLGPLPTETAKEWVAPERLALLQPPEPPQAPQNPVVNSVVVRGVVKQSSTGAGIPDVTVSLCPGFVPVGIESRTSITHELQSNAPIVRNKAYFFALWDRAVCNSPRVTTDSNGRFQFSNVAAGEYSVTAEREGYSAPPLSPAAGAEESRGGIIRPYNAWIAGSPTVVDARRLAGDIKNVSVEAQQSPADISLTLIRAGVISGRVRDADGRFLVNAPVRIVGLPAQGATGEGPTVATATTNDRGEYRAYWLLPGEYRVIASGPAGRPFSETWFPRGASHAEANNVTVREGEEVSSIDVILRPTQADAPLQPPGVRWLIR